MRIPLRRHLSPALSISLSFFVRDGRIIPSQRLTICNPDVRDAWLIRKHFLPSTKTS